MRDPVDSRGTIRVVFCHHTADVCGGSDQSLFELVTHLPRERFEAAMILKTGDPMAEAYRSAGFSVTEVPLVPPRRALEWRKHCRFALSYWPSVLRIARAIRRFRAHVVHVNDITNLQAPVAAWLAGLPRVWHVRLLLSKDRLADRAMLALVRLFATRAIANSSAVAESLVDCGDQLRTILNAIDLSEYAQLPDGGEARESLGIGPRQPLIISIGRIEPSKGQHVLVEAVPRIVKAHPDVRVVFVGGPAANKPDYQVQLKARCRELGVQTHVTFTGIRRDVPQLLAACNVLVLPTAGTESFGRTVVEAMAAGRPVVATDCGGPRDTLVNGETGWLVPTNDPKALAEKTNALLADPEKARQMGQKGRRRAFERFSLDRLVQEMGALFEEVAQGACPAS